MQFSNRNALITGAASGIGRACALYLAKQGCKELILVDLDRSELTRLTKKLKCRVKIFSGDVGDPQFWLQMDLAATPIHLSVIAAGISAAAPIAELAFGQWRKVIHSNLDGAFLALQKALQNQLAHHIPASNLLVSSISGQKVESGTAAYGCSKAALNHLVRVAAKESASANIRINAIAPAGIDTPIWDKAEFFQQLIAETGSRQAAIKALEAHSPMGRWASAEEIAAQIGFLLSDAAANITGQILASDGGYGI